MNDFEIQNVDSSKLLDVENIAKTITRLELKIGHLRWYFDKKDLSPLAWKAFKVQLPKIESVEALQPNPSQLSFIDDFDPNYHFLMQAMALSTTSAADFSPDNVSAILCMMNQQDIVKYDLWLGNTPTFFPVNPEYKGLKVSMCRGYGTITKTFVEELKKRTKKTVKTVSPAVVNFALQLSMTHSMDSSGKFMADSVMPLDIDIGSLYSNGRVNTTLGRIAGQMFAKNTVQVNGAASVAKFVFDRAPAIHSVLVSMDEAKTGPDISKVRPEVLGFQNRKFEAIPLGALHAYVDKMWKNLSKRKQFLKRIDCGDKFLNVAAKFSPVLSLISGSPFVNQCEKPGDRPIFVKPDFKNEITCCYFGAGGQRGRRVFDNRFKVDAFDLADPPKFKKEKTEKDFRNLNYKTWVKKDIYGFNKFIDYNVFVSDIFMKEWNSVDGPDYEGHVFVSNILKGLVINDTVVVSNKLPSTRVVKGFVPTPDKMQLYVDAMPFLACDTSRACTTELIFVKFPKDLKVKTAIHRICTDYRYDFHNNMKWIDTIEIFEKFCRDKIISVIKELNFQLRVLPVSFLKCAASPRNRKWFVASDDLPHLYIPRKFGLDVHHGTHIASDVFSDLYGYYEESPDDFVTDTPLTVPGSMSSPIPGKILDVEDDLGITPIDIEVDQADYADDF